MVIRDYFRCHVPSLGSVRARLYLAVVVLWLGVVSVSFARPACTPEDSSEGKSGESLVRAEDQASAWILSPETIKFAIISNGLRVGSGQLSYAGKQDELHHVQFNTSALSIQDKEDIWGTCDFASPVKVERRVKYLGKDEQIVEKYAADAKSVLITKSVNAGAPTTQTINTKDSMGNVLLFVYRIRLDPEFGEGKIYEMQLPTAALRLYVRKLRKIKVPLGVFDAFYLESQPAKYKIWIADDPYRTPVRIQGVVGPGTTYLAVTEVSRTESP